MAVSNSLRSGSGSSRNRNKHHNPKPPASSMGTRKRRRNLSGPASKYSNPSAARTRIASDVAKTHRLYESRLNGLDPKTCSKPGRLSVQPNPATANNVKKMHSRRNPAWNQARGANQNTANRPAQAPAELSSRFSLSTSGNESALSLP